eukprot:m.102457 g.102457  ORF g.102457 m.102457 type:complete len:89 (+) comp20811_c2_seq1:82-348(+)
MERETLSDCQCGTRDNVRSRGFAVWRVDHNYGCQVVLAPSYREVEPIATSNRGSVCRSKELLDSTRCFGCHVALRHQIFGGLPLAASR